MKFVSPEIDTSVCAKENETPAAQLKTEKLKRKDSVTNNMKYVAPCFDRRPDTAS